MKRCPTCDKTFDDAMRFCQSDGTPLVADEPIDPYKTMVGRPGNGADAGQAPAGSGNLGRSDDEVLELPAEPDSRKTIATTEDEIRREMAAHDASEGQVIEIPPLAGSEPSKFGEPSLSPPPFGDMSPPPSPFSSNERDDRPTFSNSTPPIPSPFGESKPAESEFSKPASSPFAEPEPFNPPPVNPFDLPADQQRNQAMAEPQWTPPPVQQSNWQEPAGGPAQFGAPPAPAAGGVNQTLPIISLVLGIVSLCCYISPVTGIAALITGFKGMKNANNDPEHYGGKGLAIAGMVTGGIFFLLGALYCLYIIFVVGLSGLFAILGALGK